MKKLFLFLIASIVLFGACGNKATKDEKQQREAMREYVESFLLRYPEATLQDIYKGSFQDYFGPAHIVSDREAAKRYILRELATADTLGGESIFNCMVFSCAEASSICESCVGLSDVGAGCTGTTGCS